MTGASVGNCQQIPVHNSPLQVSFFILIAKLITRYKHVKSVLEHLW